MENQPVPLHVWLPMPMEGPTPVVFDHAATMVLQVFIFITRIFTMLTGDALFVIATIGANISIHSGYNAITTK